MQARVQELEKLLEENDGALLRGLNKGNLKSRMEDEVSSRTSLIHAGAKGINEPRTPPSNQYATVSTGFSRRGNIPLIEGKVQENTFKLNEPRQGLIIDDAKPGTSISSIQLRLSNGPRMVARFNPHHTVADVRKFMGAARRGSTGPYEVQTMGFPPVKPTGSKQMIEGAGLLNAVVI